MGYEHTSWSIPKKKTGFGSWSFRKKIIVFLISVALVGAALYVTKLNQLPETSNTTKLL